MDFLNGKKTIIGAAGFIICKVAAAILPSVAVALDMTADYVFAPLAGIGIGHKLYKAGAESASKAILLALALPLLSGCATFKAVTSGAGNLAKDTGKAIVEDVDWRRHIADFLEGLGDLIFGEEEAPESPSPEASEAPPAETLTASI